MEGQKEIILSERLRALAMLVTPGNTVCDVGCDHGFVPIYLVQKKQSSRVLAMDVRSGPLSRAREHISACGLEGYIETRLSDGLAAFVPGEARTCIIAGMGGRLMASILSREEEKARSFEELILQPQSELPAFRRFLRTEGYRTVSENMIEEEGKFYPMMKVVPADRADVREDERQRLFDSFGEGLLKSSHPVLKRYLQAQKELLSRICRQIQEKGAEGTAERLDELAGELLLIEEAFSYMEQQQTGQDRQQ